MKQIFQARTFTSRVKHGKGNWWASGPLKFSIVCLGLGATVTTLAFQKRKAGKQRYAELLLDLSKEARCISESFNASDTCKIVYEVEKALRANEVKWVIDQSFPQINYGMYHPTELLEGGRRYRVDPLEIILALSARQGPLSPYYVLAEQTKRPRQLDEIESKFSQCVTLFAQLEKLALLYSRAIKTAPDSFNLRIDKAFFPVEVVGLVMSVSRQKQKDPLLVAALHSYIERSGERGQLAIDFIQRVDPDFYSLQWTQNDLVGFLEKYKTIPKRRSVPDVQISILLGNIREQKAQFQKNSVVVRYY